MTKKEFMEQNLDKDIFFPFKFPNFFIVEEEYNKWYE